MASSNDGDSVSLTEALTPKTWIDKQGNAKPALDMVAHGVLTAYHVQRKRRAVRAEDAATDTNSNDLHDDDL